jgi:hypothetical protein
MEIEETRGISSHAKEGCVTERDLATVSSKNIPSHPDDGPHDNKDQDVEGVGAQSDQWQNQEKNKYDQ